MPDPPDLQRSLAEKYWSTRCLRVGKKVLFSGFVNLTFWYCIEGKRKTQFKLMGWFRDNGVWLQILANARFNFKTNFKNDVES